jgi:tetratricopeptide (TPR) repeat protein
MIKKGLVNELSGITRNKEDLNPKIIDTEETYKILVEQSEFKKLNLEVFKSYENKLYSETVLRQNYYFLAQALFEERKVEKAYRTLKICEELFPNSAIPYKQYAFALGKLYVRMGYIADGHRICKIAIKNMWEELIWITSFNPQNPIINVRHAEKKYQMLIQMLNEADTMKLNPVSKEEISTFMQNFTAWKKANWPY